MKESDFIKIKPQVLNSVNGKVSVSEEIKRALCNDDRSVVDLAARQLKESIMLNLDPFVEYQIVDNPFQNSIEIYGRVHLCKLGEWESLDRDNKRHRCSVCRYPAFIDIGGNEELSAYCPMCGAFLGGDYT